MPRSYKPPQETVAQGRGAALPAVSGAILACAATAALFGGDATLAWAESLPVHPLSDLAVAVAVQWREATGALGIGDLGAAARQVFRAVQAYAG